jgi:hypothetical protein
MLRIVHAPASAEGGCAFLCIVIRVTLQKLGTDPAYPVQLAGN